MPATDNYQGSAVAVDQPADDMVPVTPSDSVDLDIMAKALYVTMGGAVAIVTRAGNVRTVTVPNNFILPVRASRINSTGTTASGIWAFV